MTEPLKHEAARESDAARQEVLEALEALKKAAGMPDDPEGL